MLDESIKKFLYAVGEGVAHEAKKVAPVVTGNLKNDIKVYRRFSTQNGVEIGNSKITPYAPYVHYGTSPYKIKRKTKKGKTIKMKHPGIKANPYLDNGLKNYISSGNFQRAVDKAGFEEDVIKELKLDEFGIMK